VRGKGVWVWDEKGRKYLDSVAGIATCSLGHSDNSLRRALTKQLNKIQHVSNLYHIPEQELLATWLINHSCADKVFFCNSGAEANEAAIKLGRKYGNQILGLTDPIILSAKSSFHGRTLATLSATGQPQYQKGFEPLVQGFKFFDYNDIDSFHRIIKNLNDQKKSVSAILIEPLQAEGGIHPGEKKFFKALRKFCSEKNILLILDEIQTGICRTGKFWGYENLGIEPDAFTLAKGLGGGHAIGALLVKNIANILLPGEHASTFGGNPFACQAALTVLKEIEKRSLISNVNKRSNQLQKGLNDIVKTYNKYLQEVRGIGLIQGLVIKEGADLNSQDFTKHALTQNLLVVPAGPKVIRMVPPLIISRKEVKILLRKLDLTFSKYI
tara:strand:- start:750 stop:1898 length:1149 start_codon:yes stop_codon:yes gene_type:complete